MAKRNDGGERLREIDLLIEVLSRLDVKTLLQCKSVSKAWYSLISSPVFIKSHLNRAFTNGADNETVTLIVRYKPKRPRNAWSRISLKERGSFSLFQPGGCDNLLGFPYSKGDYVLTPPCFLIGCVCGIVCVGVIPFNAMVIAKQTTAEVQTDIYIWNPATKQSRLIPAYTLHDGPKTLALGFGFDPIDSDFKVVRVLSGDMFPEVYSLNRNVWRKIEATLSNIPMRPFFEFCIHGFLFRIGLNGVMAFDLNKEVFICDIQLPVRSDCACITEFSITEFKDSIAVIFFHFEEQGNRIELWTLDDEACLRGARVDASWTMMFTIDVRVDFDWVFGLFNSDEFFVRAMGELFSYNLDKNVWRFLQTNSLLDFDVVFQYTESLLPVAGSKLVNWSNDEDDNVESSTESEEVSEENSVDSEDDDDERSSVGVGSEDDNEDSTVGSEDDDERSSVGVGSEDGNEDSTVGSEDDNEDSTVGSEDDEENIGDSEDDNEEKSADSGDE